MSATSVEARLKRYGILLVLIPCFLLTAVFTGYAIKNTYDTTVEHLNQVISIQENAISRFLLEKSVAINKLAQSAAIRTGDRQAIAASLQTIYQHHNDYHGLMFIDENGSIIVSVGMPLTTQASVAGQIYFQRAQQGSSSISPFFVDSQYGNPIIAFSTPVYDTAYQFRGVIVASVKLASVTSLLETAKTSVSGITYLIDENGTQLTNLRLAPSTVDSASYATLKSLQLLPQDDSNRRTLTTTLFPPFFWNNEGQLVLAISQSILDDRWQIIGEVAVSEVMQPVLTLLTSLLILTAIILAASLRLSRALAQQVRTPLWQLQTAAAGIQRGDYTAAMTANALTDAPAELRELGAAFSQMACTVQDSILRLNETSAAFMEAELKYRNLVENSIVGVYIVLDECFSYVNPRFAEIFGYTPQELLGMRMENLIAPAERSMMDNKLEQLFLGEVSFVQFEIKGLRHGGTTIWIEFYGTICSFSEGPALMGTIIDITASKQAAAAILLSEARYRAVVEDQTDMICRFLPDGTITFANKVWCEATGRSREQLISCNLASLIPRKERRRLKALLAALTPENPVQTTELHILLPNNQTSWQQWVTRGIFDDNNRLVEFQAVGRDITKRKLQEEELKYLSMHDQLTGLFNRTYFEHQLAALSSAQDAVGIIIGDLDGLKLTNDTQGHAIGDSMLKAAAAVLKECFNNGQVVARIGGDEFAVLWPQTTQAELATACKKLKRLIAAYNERHRQQNAFVLSMSLGYAVSGGDKLNMTDLFKQADHYMYREKLHHAQSQRNATLQALTRALEARDFITQGHADRLQHLVAVMARAIALPEHRVQELELLAQFHDIGKVGIPDSILFKPGPLSPEEKLMMQRHAEIGYRIAQASPDLVPIADWILKHHEWWDGSGYPLGLSGQAIPLECRLLAITDAYDAMTSDRPYRKALTHEQTLAELKKCAGRQFDPKLVEVFCKTFA